jgi:trehalose synthase-fused probable maltokinase
MSGEPVGPNRWHAWLDDGARERLAADLLAYVRGRRWFRAKTRVSRGARLVDIVPLDAEAVANAEEILALLEIGYAEGEPDLYAIPLCRRRDGDEAREDASPAEGLVDGLVTGTAAAALFDLARTAGARRGEAGELRASASPLFGEVVGREQLVPKVPRMEQTNSTILFGDRALLKIYRRLESGPSPEVEMGRYLTGICQPPCAPRVLGTVTYHSDIGPPRALGVVHEFVANDGDAWSLALRELERYFDRVLGKAPERIGLAGGRNILSALDEKSGSAAESTIGPFFSKAGVLGRRIGALHLALARGAEAKEGGDDFSPAPFTASDRAAVSQRAESMLDGVLETLRAKLDTNPYALGAEIGQSAHALLAAGGSESIRRQLAEFREGSLDAQKTRTHGDLHLGQILALPGGDFTIIDFEGEPARPLSERRAKSSPIRDVMGMVRSFDYAPIAALRDRKAPSKPSPGRAQADLANWGRLWTREITLAFLRAYFDTVGDAAFIPRDRAQLARLLTAFELEKVIYEVGYELDNRPDWVGIPLASLVAIANRGEMK